MSNRCGTNGLRYEVDVFSINIFDDHNLLLGKEMQSKVANSFSQNTLLEEKNIGTRLNDLLDDAKNVLTLLFDDSVHSNIIANNNIRLHITLRSTDRELY